MVALLDSVVVAGFLDGGDAFHEVADARIRQLVGRERLAVSVITYAEILTGAHLGHHDVAAARGFFNDLVAHTYDVDRAIADRAAELRSQTRSLRMPDALILATADVQGVDIVLTGDERWSRAPIAPTVELLAPRS